MAERRGHKRIRGIAVRVAVFLLLGAVVNVAVAWVLGWRIPSFETVADASATTPGSVANRDLYIEWRAFKKQAFGATGFESSWSLRSERSPNLSSSVHPKALLPNGFELEEPSDSYMKGKRGAELRVVQLRGLPWRSMATTLSFHDLVSKPPRAQDGLIIGAISEVTRPGMRRIHSDGRRIIPLRPIWPGFAINTVFYAALLWLLFAAPGRVRHWRRVRRGLCAKCAYPIGTSEVCTECGTRLKKSIQSNG